jgi:ribosomal protein L37AE/L43A
MMQKCFFCGLNSLIRFGKRDGRQLYKCNSCGRRFIGGNHLIANDVIADYVEHKMILSELSFKYAKSGL